LPLLLEADGAKLSKSARSLPVAGRLDRSTLVRALFSTLTQLSQAPPPYLVAGPIEDVWKWAIAHWNPQALAGKPSVRLSAHGDKSRI
jgi:glutamyl-Q tRNA(Asp) synthetase